MTATPFKITVLGDLPNEDSWAVWAKKINGELSPNSPALVTPYVPPDNEFYQIDECWHINSFKDSYLKKGQSLEQFIIDFIKTWNEVENESANEVEIKDI